MVCGMSLQPLGFHLSQPAFGDDSLISEAQRRFAVCNQLYADKQERDERDWLTFWAGPQWGDEAPNRLFGAWLNQDGEAV